MENRLNQRRVSFSSPQPQKHTRDDEFVAAIAATAFSIYSLEEAGMLDLKKIRDSPKFTENLTIRGKEENRQPSYGETSMKRPFRQETRTAEGALPLRSSSGISPRGGYQKQNGVIVNKKNDKAKAEAWEKSKIERIQKRHEKMKLQILSWEGEKRIQAKLHMEKKKNELDHNRANAIEHYKRKIARIDMIGQRAIKELEDQRRKEEMKVREKANNIRKTGKVPVTCFCFKSL
ncbi:remorin 1.4-like [Trifolium pratense]|uniref:remorin 1.4-like n=1 Tax=Trifolium pratense TaxID=57577 RepID=UPI001E6960A2|nr:remorin 1.4-like [Trifolium pratense]